MVSALLRQACLVKIIRQQARTRTKPGPQLENIPWLGKQFKGEGGQYSTFNGGKYTKYNKINNNPENLRGQDIYRAFPPSPLSCGPELNPIF